MRKAYALSVSIFEDKAIGNCSNHGISERYKDVLLLHDRGNIAVDLDNPPENLCRVVKRHLFGKIYMHVEPVAAPVGVGYMAGGSLVYSCDSRFREISDYPLSLHDRCESQELYDMLSN